MTTKTKKVSLFIVSFICCFCMAVGIIVGYNANAQTEKQNAKKDYAIVLSEYTILKTEGVTKVVDPNGYKVSYEGGKFLPLCAGDYKIFYGDAYEIVTILRSNPEVTFDYAEEISTTYSTGDALLLPTANIESVIGKYENYYVSIAFNGQEIENLHSSNIAAGYSFVFDRGGKYTITYSCTDNTSLKYTAKDVHNITVMNNAAIIMNEMPSELFFGYSINIGAVYGLYDGKVYPAELSVTLPSGEVETVNDIVYLPKNQGVYTFTATSNIEGQVVSTTKTVEVIVSSGNLFSNSYAISKIESGVDLPSYSLQKGKGVYIEAQTSSSSIYYSKIIDLKDFDKEDSLINFVPYADGESGNQDEIKVTLIDAHDTNNQLTLRWWYKSSVSTETYMVAYLNGREYGAINNEVEDGDVRTLHGSVAWGCYFNAHNQGAKARMFNLHFDYEENAVYSLLRNGYSSSDRLYKIIDMDDPLKLGYANVWDGFTTGEVYLKIEFTSSQPISGIYVESVAGQKLDAELLPDISNETCFVINSEYEQMPNGAVDYFYTFPKVVKNILVNSEVTTTLTKGGQVVNATEQGFKPTEAGEYTLTFSAIDNYGKKNEKTFTFTVNQTPNPINVQTPSDINVELFTDYVIPEIEVSGGSGNLVIEKRLLLDEKPLESFAGAYFIDTAGSYFIEITVTDFLGYSVTEKFKLNVNKDFVSLSLESDILSVRAGQTVELPKFNTYDFMNEIVPEKTLEIVANGNVIQTFSGDNAYSFDVPEGYSNLTLKYYSGKGTDREKVLEKNVKVLPKNINKITDLVILEGEVKALSLLDGILYMAKDNAKVKFPNPVPVEGLNLVYGIDAETINNFDGFTIRFIDAVNPEIVVEFKFYDISANGSAKIEVNNDGKVYIAKYSLDSYDNDNSYDAERKTYIGKAYYSYATYFDAALNKLNYAGGTEMAAVSQLKDGRVFEGFSSGLVFVEFEFNGVIESEDYNSKIIVKTVSNQNMDYFIENESSYVDGDTTGPNLLFANKMVNYRTTINSRFVVSSAMAYDFIQQGSSYARVTVKDPSQKTIINEQLKESTTITLDKYGTYTVQYRATDYLGKTTVKTFNVVVYDSEEPTIIVNGTIKKEYSVGSKLTLPGCSVSDNCSQNLTAKIYIKTPSADYLLLVSGQNYEFKEKGSYLLVYSAQDEFGNLRRITYDITVK